MLFNNRLKKTSKIIAVFFIASYMTSCQSKEERAIVPEHEKGYCLDSTLSKTLEVINPEDREVIEALNLAGMVETNPDRVVHFVSLVTGVISNTFFALGDKVREGQVLAEMQSAELSSLQAEYKNLESQIRRAEKQLTATQSMFADGIASQRDLGEAQTSLEILQADFQKVKSILNLYSASSERGVFQIKAPANGIITEKSIVAGTQVAANGQGLFTISDLTEVWIMVNVHASSVPKVKPGMLATMKTLAYQNDEFVGRIAAIAQVYDREEGVLKARISLSNPLLQLKPGMLVDVTVENNLSEITLAVPESCLVFDDNMTFALIYHDNCVIEIRRVVVQTTNKGWAFISEGLRKQDKVIAKNQLLIYEQLKHFTH